MTPFTVYLFLHDANCFLMMIFEDAFAFNLENEKKSNKITGNGKAIALINHTQLAGTLFGRQINAQLFEQSEKMILCDFSETSLILSLCSMLINSFACMQNSDSRVCVYITATALIC